MYPDSGPLRAFKTLVTSGLPMVENLGSGSRSGFRGTEVLSQLFNGKPFIIGVRGISKSLRHHIDGLGHVVCTDHVMIDTIQRVTRLILCHKGFVQLLTRSNPNDV